MLRLLSIFLPSSLPSSLFTVLPKALLCALALLVLQACSDASLNDASASRLSSSETDQTQQPVNSLALPSSMALTVYKSPTCGCCAEWVNHIESAGFTVKVIEQQAMAHLKDKFGIPANARSCHTAVSASGAIFEGHVPAKDVKSYLVREEEGAGQSSSLGLTVPGMPVGSPGMEVDDKFMPYAVLELSKTGETTSYVKYKAYEAQF